MDRAHQLKRLRFRAWHRGTREADFMIGGFFDAASPAWGEAEIVWFEALLEEQDVDIMAWAMRRQPWPDQFAGPLQEAMARLDYIDIPQ